MTSKKEKKQQLPGQKLQLNKRFVGDLVQMILGNIVCAFAIASFALPTNMVVSGMSGIGRMVHHYSGIEVATVVGVCNVILFLIGWITLGHKFAASVAIGTFVFPTFLGIFQSSYLMTHLVEDKLLGAICAGIANGVGLGLVIRAGGSTGGTDIPAIIANRKLGWKVAPILYISDVIIFLIQIPVTDTDGIILGIVYALLYSVVMNQLITMAQGGVQLMIVTDDVEGVNEKLLSMNFGTTLLNAMGGYMHDAKEVICCIASRRNLSKIKREILNIDPKAFISITSINEINGNGFTWWSLAHEDYRSEFETRLEQTQSPEK